MLLLGSEIALRIAQIIYSIQQVGLAGAIGSRNAGYGLFKREGSIAIVAELRKCYLGKQGERI
jgi:hypothetical protein